MSEKWLVVLKNGFLYCLTFKTKFYRARHKHYLQHKGEWIPRQTGLWLTWRGQRNMSHCIKGTVLIIMRFKQRLAFWGNIFAQIFEQTVKTLSNINLVLSRHGKREKSSLPVACVAGAWKQWVKERTGAREGETRRAPSPLACLLLARLFFLVPTTFFYYYAGYTSGWRASLKTVFADAS